MKLSVLPVIGAALALAIGACSDDPSVDPGPATGGASAGGAAAGGQGGASSGGFGGAGAGGHGGDGGSGGAGGGCQNLLPSSSDAPELLSQTGLYADVATRAIATSVAEFSPAYPLWSDGVEKRRFVYLPECDPVIDNTDEDDWSFPVGTRMWKEFSLGGVLLETRLVHRYGPGPDDFLFATYAWRADDTDADRVTGGVDDVRGTEHDIPPVDACGRCHGPHNAKGGLPSRYLGFSALQLSHDGPGVTMASLSADGHLAIPNAVGYAIPGDPVAQAALGYLHSNCATCHNDSPDGLLFPFIDLRVRTSDADVASTATWQTAVNAPATLYMTGCSHRILGGDPLASCFHVRMNARGSDGMPNSAQMPPLATDEVDTEGLAALDAWIITIPAP